MSRSQWAEACTTELMSFAFHTKNSSSVVLATFDGLEIAATAPHPLARARHGLMSNLLKAMGLSMLHSENWGSGSHLVIETADGTAVIMPVSVPGGELLLSIVAEPGALPGPLLWAASRCGQRIRVAAERYEYSHVTCGSPLLNQENRKTVNVQ